MLEKQGDLSRAVADGVLDAQQAERLSAYLATAANAGKADGAPDEPINPDDERFRLIGGFNDIFVTIGLFLVFGAIFGLVRGPAAALAFMAVSWGLSEIFTRRFRMALPSIILAMVFPLSAGFLMILMLQAFDGPVLQNSFKSISSLAQFLNFMSLPISTAAAAAAALHYWRFRVAIDVAIAAMALLWIPVALLMKVSPFIALDYGGLVSLVTGLILFALAMRFDLSDPARTTRRSDIAFWLHLCAAPKIVSGLAVCLGFTGRTMIGSHTTFFAVGVLAATMVFTIIALLVDRRALIVSALAYAGIAFGYLISAVGNLGQSFTLTMLFLGLMVLGLSIGWRPLRALLVPLIAPVGLQARLPPVYKAKVA